MRRNELDYTKKIRKTRPLLEKKKTFVNHVISQRKGFERRQQCYYIRSL